tara:strand:+ start:308 stop:469 length:162 start_codon:yes stop_codon:yes gene_type:complete
MSPQGWIRPFFEGLAVPPPVEGIADIPGNEAGFGAAVKTMSYPQPGLLKEKRA